MNERAKGMAIGVGRAFEDLGGTLALALPCKLREKPRCVCHPCVTQAAYREFLARLRQTLVCETES